MTTLERRVLDALPMTVYAVDLDGRITMINRSWSRFALANGAQHLCEERGVIGSSIWDAIGEGDTAERVRQAMITLREGRASSLSWEFPCSSPTEERIFLMQVSAIASVHSVTGFVFSTVDITPSHRSREVLINAGLALARPISLDRVLDEVSQQLRSSMACDAIAIALYDEGTHELRLAHSSGFDEAEARELQQRLSSIWHDAMTRGEVITRMPDGGIEITAPMISGGEQRGAVTLVSASRPAHHRLEETQRVLATIAAEAAGAIERALLVRRLADKKRLEAIGEVSAGVAHELRNPLFGISSAAQLLRFRVQDDPVVEKNVGRILKEVERLNSMVTSLLEYGRPTPIQFELGDPDAIWDDVIENQRGRLESRSLRLERIRCAAIVVRLDPQHLAQVFINILVNAVDAAPDGSTLALTSSLASNGAWRCRLQNGGTPISQEALPRVFDIFFSSKPGGTGIGLALCQRIMEEHRGTIAIESGADSGTVVSMMLPPE